MTFLPLHQLGPKTTSSVRYITHLNSKWTGSIFAYVLQLKNVPLAPLGTSIQVPPFRCLKSGTSVLVPQFRYLSLGTSTQIPQFRYLCLGTSIQVAQLKYLYLGTSIQVPLFRYFNGSNIPTTTPFSWKATFWN